VMGGSPSPMPLPFGPRKDGQFWAEPVGGANSKLTAPMRAIKQVAT
jgi:hypothetical protein